MHDIYESARKMRAEAREKAASNVYDYFTMVLGEEPLRDAGTKGLREYSIDSNCGQECKKIIDKAQELLAICDSHTDVVRNIRKGVCAAVEVICFG